MVIAATVLTEGGAEHSSTSFTTASVSPTESVVLLAFGTFENSNSTPAGLSVSGCGLTWSKVNFASYDTSGNDRSSMEVWLGTGTPTSGTITVTYLNSVRRSAWIVQEISGADTTTPVVQSNSAVDNAASVTGTLAAFADSVNNAVFVASALQDNSDIDRTTFEVGYTELAEAWFSYAHISTGYKIGEDTSIVTTFSTAARCGTVVIELAASSGPATQTINCNVITASSTVFNPIVTPGTVSVQTNLIVTSSTVFQPTLKFDVILPVINTTTTLFDPSTVADVVLQVINTVSNLFNPTVRDTQTVQMQSISTSSTLFSPTVNQDLILNVINTTATVQNPSVNTDVVLPVINAPSNLHQPATDVTINIEADLITTTSSILNPELNQDVSLPLVPVAETVFSPTVGEDTTIVETDFIDAPSTVLNPEVTTLSVITCQTVVTSSSVHNPELSYVVQAEVVVTTSTIHEPSLEYVVSIPLINTAPTVNSPSIGDPPPPSEATGAIVKTNNPSPFPIGI